ncbi:MAG: exo-alpha-sialidase, partial [Chloroflexi bacterium]|nr:exo-alpha-sialidase [Chloroflexota bacterium]
MGKKGAFSRMWWFVASLALVAVLALPAAPTRADVPQPAIVSPSGPIRPVLSGFSWLAASGYDLLWARHGMASRLTEVQTQAPGGAGLIPYRSPAAKFSRNILVTQDFSRFPFQTEPHLAIDPKDPQHLLLGTIDYGFPGLSMYTSIDGGTTWEGPFQPPYPHGELGTAGDPVVAFGRDGAAYSSFITVDVQEYTLGILAAQALVSSISVSNSRDGGTTWREAVISSRSNVTSKLVPTPGQPQRPRGTITFEFLDKPWMSIGPNPRDPSRDTIYVTYTKFAEEWGIFWLEDLPFLSNPTVMTTIEMVRSEDGGVTWSEPLAVSPTVRRTFGGQAGPAEAQPIPGEPQGTRRFVQGSQPVVDPQDGTLYIAWLDTTDDDSFEGQGEIFVARSTDGGRRFDTPVKAASFLEPAFRSRTAFFRSWGAAFPQVAVGPGGEVYVAFVGLPPLKQEDDGDVLLVRSTDRGKTWSLPTRVNDDETSRFQFFP